jgi:ParB family protein of integrating conjugative element (PFGI_1 class)
MTTRVTVVSTKGGVGTTSPAAEKVQESLVGPACELDGDPIEPTPMTVPIERILEYDRNPRRERNEAYVEIETSIRRRGFVGTLAITRRPGESHYRVAEGGNTVLRILKDLYEETQDPRFHTVQCLFEP